MPSYLVNCHGPGLYVPLCQIPMLDWLMKLSLCNGNKGLAFKAWYLSNNEFEFGGGCATTEVRSVPDVVQELCCPPQSLVRSKLGGQPLSGQLLPLPRAAQSSHDFFLVDAQ